MRRNWVGFSWLALADRKLDAGRRSRRGNRHRLRPALLELEERVVLSPFIVSKTTDDGSEGTLRWAIGQANAASGASTIEFSSLFNTPQTINLAGSVGGGNGLVLTNTTGLETIVGPAGGVFVEGSYVISKHVNHVFWINEGVQASISNLIIAEGFDESPISGGGGMHNDGTVSLSGCTFLGNVAFMGGGLDNWGSATLTNCRFSGNTAYGDALGFGLGGAIFNEGVALAYNNPATVTLTNCTISGNTASVSGGGLYNKHNLYLYDSTLRDNTADIGGGALYNLATTKLTDCTVSQNTSNRYGGGLYNKLGVMDLTRCTVSGNSAEDGAGLQNEIGTLNLTDCTVKNNTASQFGGGVFSNDFNNNGAGAANLTNCTISGNSAPNAGGMGNRGTANLTNCTVDGNPGGGLYNVDNLTLQNCTVSNNKAKYYGGGLYNVGTATLVNCTFFNDTADAGYYGGGLYNDGTATLQYCTFSKNTATFGGGIYNFHSGTVDLQNTIVAGNTAPSGGPDVYADASSSGFNLIGETDDSDGWGSSDITGTSAQPVDPRLASLGNYGGPTQTMAVLPGSRAIGGGVSVPGVTTDQRGLPRGGGSTDIGAFESSGFTMAVVRGNNQAARVNTAFVSPLTVKVSSINPVEPVQGGVVGFIAPASGASCIFPGGNIFVSIDGSGLANISATASSVIGPYTVTATTFGDAVGNRVNANFTLTNASPAPYQLVIHTQPSPTATAGVALSTQPVIYVEDQAGNLETGDNTTRVTVGLKSGTGPLGGTTTITVSGGVATFTNLFDNRAETISLLFTSVPALKTAISSNIVVSAAAPDSLVIHTQPSPTATAGATFSAQPVIYVQDKFGNLETGDSTTKVTVGLKSGAGPLGGTTTVTVSGGVARFSKLSDNRAETISLLFTSLPALKTAISNNIVVSAAAPSALVIHTQPSPTAVAGVAFGTQPVIYVQDKFGNLETGDNSTKVTVSLQNGAGPLGGTTTVTVSGGVARFTNLYDSRAETINLVFTSGLAVSSAISSDVVVSPAALDLLVIHTQPSPTATAGVAFATQPVIYVEDQFGNLETGDNTTQITVALQNGAGPLGGATTITVSGGVARFTDLYDPTTETIHLLFTSQPALAPAISSEVVVTAAAPYRLVLHTPPSPTATAGVAFSTQPVIYVEDQYGNLEIDDFTTQVTASLRVGAGPLQGTVTVTAFGGIATFTNLSNDTAERIIVMFTSRALVKAQSDPITVNFAETARRSIIAPATAAAGGPFSITVPAISARRA
jgi:hypothetical protein